MQLPTNDAILATLQNKPLAKTPEKKPTFSTGISRLGAQTDQTIADVIPNLPEGTKKTGADILDLLRKLGQGSLRGYMAVGQGISNVGNALLAPPGQGGKELSRTYTPGSTFEKELFGTDQPIGPKSYGEEVLPGEVNVGGGHTFNAKNIPALAPILGFALGVADAIPGGGMTKDGAVQILKGVKGEIEAGHVLSSVTGMSSTVARKYVPEILKAGSDEAKISSVVDRAVAESQDVARMAERTAQKLGISKDVAEKMHSMSPDNIKRAGADTAYEVTDTAREMQDTHGSKTLSPEQRTIERQAFAKIDKEGMPALVQEYIKKNGNVLNTDEARELFDTYAKDRTQSAAVHEPSSMIKNAAFDELLKTRKGVANDTVLATMGGTGAGKTSGLRALGEKVSDYAMVLDSNMNKFNAAKKNIDKALANGYKVKIQFTYNDIRKAYGNALGRADRMEKAKGSGRTLPIPEHIATHVGSHDVYPELLSHYSDNPNVKFRLVDNSGDTTRILSADEVLAFLEEKRYNGSYDELEKALRQDTQVAKDQGRISAKTANGFESGGQSGIGKGNDALEQAPGKTQIKDTIPRPKTLAETAARNDKLIRDISAEKMSGPVKDILQPHFPTLTDTTLTAFSKRLAQLKRPSDIEALLSSMQRIENQANETGQRILDATMPISVRSALTPRQAQLTVDQLTREVKTPEHAALAEAEYNTLWEHADQRVIDRFNEANVERAILDEVLADHRGAQLNKLFQGTFLSPKEWSLGELMEKKKGKGFDSRIDEIMGTTGGDIEDAQRTLEDYFGIKQQHTDLHKEISELRPKVRSAQIVRQLLDELPVVENGKIAGIDHLANSADIRGYRDISGFAGGFRDVYRNFEHFFGHKFDEVKHAVLDPFDDAKGRYVDLYNKLGDEIGKNIVEKFNIKRGSAESAAVQDWGERDLMTNPATANPDSKYHTRDALLEKFGEDRTNDIMQADEWFRNKYTELITKINDTRKKIYPNNPSKLIPFRKDYYRHYEELGNGFMDAVRNFMDVPSGIDPKLVGVSEFTKPKSKFLSFAQQRKGPITRRDAVGGFLDYAPSAAYAIEIDPQIGVFRYLRRKLAEAAPIQGSSESGVKQQGIDNMLQFLDDFSNNLATKTNPVDRWIQKRIPGGRAAIKAIDWANNRVKANTILGNVGSSLAQLANIPQGIASAKQYAAPGMARTIASLFDKNRAAGQSTFLKERYLTGLKDRYPVDFWTKPVKASTEAVGRKAADMMKIGDMIGSHFIWNSHYAKAVAQGIEDPVKYADHWTRKLVAGRGIGELPVDQQAKITQMLAPFTVEVQNLWWVMKDQVKARDFAGLAILLFANYLFNEGSERTRGSRVVYDPINALVEGGATLQREVKGGDALRGGLEFLGRQVGEVATNVPGGQLVTSNLPDEMFGMKKADFFGQGDPNRFGPPVLFAGALQNPLWKIAPPFGGAQLQKTYKGVQALLSGKTDSKSGKTNFPVAWTPQNFVRATLFGPNATSEANKSYGSNDDIRARLASQDEATAKLGDEAEQKWADLKQLRATGGKDAVAAEWSKLAKEQPELLKKMNTIAKEEEKGLTSTDRLVMMLNVGNGERARYIVDQMHSLKTKEEKQQLWTEYAKKKILTKEVAKQVADLLSKEGH